MNDKADVILFFDMPLGKESLSVAFWGTDLEQAIDLCSEPYRMASRLVRGVVDEFQRKHGYKAYRNTDRSFQAIICVRKGFDVDTARAIAKTFMVRVADGLVKEFLGGSGMSQ